MRFALRVAAMAAGLVLMFPLHQLWRLAGARSPWPRLFLRWVGSAAGLKVRVAGTPLQEHVLYLVNHLSWLDIVALGGATGARFVSKDEVRDWPLVGALARLAGTIFVARAERQAVHAQAETLRSALTGARPVALFPEGTTGDGLVLRPFRPSLLNALWPPLPELRVQPVALDYGPSAPDIAWPEAAPFGWDARRLLGRPGAIPLTLRFLPPLDPSAFPDRKALAAAARDAIAATLPASAPPGDPL